MKLRPIFPTEMGVADEMRANVLFVDDELILLNAYRRAFESETGINLVTIHDSRSALRLLEETRFDVIVSDFVMPHVRGDQLLAAASLLQPHARRIMLTGSLSTRRCARTSSSRGRSTLRRLESSFEKP
ncbi:MAG: response regulator [Kofleriaceae bacterium]